MCQQKTQIYVSRSRRKQKIQTVCRHRKKQHETISPENLTPFSVEFTMRSAAATDPKIPDMIFFLKQDQPWQVKSVWNLRRRSKGKEFCSFLYATQLSGRQFGTDERLLGHDAENRTQVLEKWTVIDQKIRSSRFVVQFMEIKPANFTIGLAEISVDYKNWLQIQTNQSKKC